MYPRPCCPSGAPSANPPAVSRIQNICKRFCKAEQALRDSEERFRALVNATSYVVYRMSPDWTEMRQLGGRGFMPSAPQSYVQGVMERSGMEIHLDIDENFGRLPSGIELAIFRLVQECLTNVHRHSGSKTATIRLNREAASIRVEVRDQGRGISPDRLSEIQSQGSGVGMTGIRERLREFSGEMNIESTEAGTTIAATIPIPQERHTAQTEPLQAAV